MLSSCKSLNPGFRAIFIAGFPGALILKCSALRFQYEAALVPGVRQECMKLLFQVNFASIHSPTPPIHLNILSHKPNGNLDFSPNLREGWVGRTINHLRQRKFCLCPILLFSDN